LLAPRLSTILGADNMGTMHHTVIMQSPAAVAPPGTSGASRACREDAAMCPSPQFPETWKRKSGGVEYHEAGADYFAKRQLRKHASGHSGRWVSAPYLRSLFGLELRPWRGRLRRPVLCRDHHRHHVRQPVLLPGGNVASSATTGASLLLRARSAMGP
jgi:hypothetical protein